MTLTPELLVILNTTDLARKDNRLYQVLQSLIQNLAKAEKLIAAGSDETGFVTTKIGGTPDQLAMFTETANIEDVTEDGISNALDLLS